MSQSPEDLTGFIITPDNQYCATGGFGDVYKCIYRRNGNVKEVAVKTFRFEFSVEGEATNEKLSRMIRRELGIWKRLDHLNIVPFLGTVSGFGRLGNTSLVSLWMPHGTLQDFISKQDDTFAVDSRLYLLLDIANGLQYLHSQSIIHGDLSPNNVLLDEHNYARLTDFGYASLTGEQPPEAPAYLNATTARPGTLRWAAPESLGLDPEETPYRTIKSDIFSFGNISLQVLSGKLPWPNISSDAGIVLQLSKGCMPPRPQSPAIDDRHWEFIERCWSPVQDRPDAERLVDSITSFLYSTRRVVSIGEGGVGKSAVASRVVRPPEDLTEFITNCNGQCCATGGFGDVYKCIYRQNGDIKEVAVKTFRFEFTMEDEGRNEKFYRMIRRELGIWKRLDHLNIVPFLGTVSGFGRLGNISLVSLWMPNGTLQDFISKQDDTLAVDSRLHLLLNIANGLQYLHSQSIIHGDLSPNNVLLDKHNNARLTDFGHASSVGELPEALAYLNATTVRPGTLHWAAPECLGLNPGEAPHRTAKSDIFSFGSISLQVLSGRLPWSNIPSASIIIQLSQGRKPPRPQYPAIDDPHWKFVERCWSPVQDRPDAEQLITSITGFLYHRIRHVVFIGEGGAGKSSIINLVAGRERAATSSDCAPCTHGFDSYDVLIDDETVYRLWDTPSLDEPRIFGIFKRSLGENAVRRFLQERFRRGELDLLVFCTRGDRALQSMSKAYKIFGVTTRQVAVPVVIAISHLEQMQPTMDIWWDLHERQLSALGFAFDGHACITSLPSHHRRRASQDEIRCLISTKCRKEAGAMPPDAEYLPAESRCVIC